VTRLRATAVLVVLGGVVAALLARDALTVNVGKHASEVPSAVQAAWTEVKWPFPLDQWGLGRAFKCSRGDCGTETDLYLRAKLGFCNCATGVSDDTELDRVGDLELLSATFKGLKEGRPIAVGWMSGRSRPYGVSMRYGSPRAAVAVAFNDKCDVVVATVVAPREGLASAERAALEFLNGDLILRWVERELGL
jgi:hypothetical protein